MNTANASERTRSTKRIRFVLVGALIVVLPALALVAGSAISSPAQRAANAAPPKPSLITVAVQKRQLVHSVVVQGTLVAAHTVQITPEAGSGSVAVVSGVHASVGSTLHEGDVAVEISGRPVIVLGGAVPAYRDLQPGNTGTDVVQLHEALDRLGLPTGGDRRDTYGAATQSAVRRLYQRAGAAPATAAAPAAAAAAPAAGAAGGNNAGAAPPSDPTPAPTPPPVITLPRAEVVYVPDLPALVTQSNAALGSTVSTGTTPLMTLSSGAVTVHATAPPDQGQFVRVGTAAVLTTYDGKQQHGTVSQVAAQLTQSGDGSLGYEISITGTGALPAALVGQNVQVSLADAATSAAVLAVPSSAISSAPNGDTDVTVASGRRTRTVHVQTGTTADGWVAISTSPPDELHVGDEVVVGTDNANPSNPSNP